MEKAIWAFGGILEKAGVSLQTVTGDDILWFVCVVLAVLAAVALMVLWTAVALDWWEIAGRFRVAVFVKDCAADFREWCEIRARLRRLKAVHRANFNNNRR